MVQKRMSERLEASREFIAPGHKSLFVRMYQGLHGNSTFATLQNIFTAVGIIATFLGDIDEEEFFRNTFIILSYIDTSTSVRFWGTNRKKAEEVFSEMVTIARVLEEWSTTKQLMKLIKVSNKAKLLTDLYNLNATLIILYYLAYPAIAHTLALSVPLLPDTEFWFWVLHSIEGTLLVVGIIANGDMLVYHLQVTICLSGLLDNISEQFLLVKTGHRLNALIEKHHELLDTSSKFRVLCSRWTFIQVFTMLLLLTANTFTCIQGSRDLGTMTVIPMCLIFVYVFCVFGESMIVASEKIGLCVYNSEWLEADFDFRRKLVMVMGRSQIPQCLDAGLIGTLSLATFADILRLWYKFVQALRNLM